MKTIDVLRNGTFCQVFVDQANNQALSIPDWNNPPRDFGFPLSTSQDQLPMALSEARVISPGEKITFRYVDNPDRKEPQVIVRNKNMSKLINKDFAASPTPIPEPSEGVVDHTLGKALDLFRIELGKYEVAGTKQKARFKKEIETIAGFILDLWPQAEEQLIRAKDGLSRRKFTLDD